MYPTFGDLLVSSEVPSSLLSLGAGAFNGLANPCTLTRTVGAERGVGDMGEVPKVRSPSFHPRLEP